jgi:hypothetical protein
VISQGLEQRSVVPYCGAGSAAMPFAPGNIEAGFFLAIPALRIKLAPSSICTNAFGRALRWAPMTKSFQQMKRAAFKPAAANSLPSRRRQTTRCASSTSTFARVPGPI